METPVVPNDEADAFSLFSSHLYLAFPFLLWMEREQFNKTTCSQPLQTFRSMEVELLARSWFMAF